MRRTTRAALVSALILLPGSFLVARAAWVKAKGEVGEVLIDRALDATLKDGQARRPWSWADMHPIARVTVPRLGIERPVLSNATGSALAFGIGHVDGTVAPGASGHCVLAGHRDSWAAFLADLRVGDDVVIETYGARAIYQVASTEVVRFDDARVLRDEGDDRLTLVTCWPFRGWLHSPWRYVVRCERVTRGDDSEVGNSVAGRSQGAYRAVAYRQPRTLAAGMRNAVLFLHAASAPTSRNDRR